MNGLHTPSPLVAGKSLAKFQGQTLTELCNKLGTPMLGGTYATFGIFDSLP